MMRDELGTLFTDDDFAALFPTRGQPAEAPWRLALVTIMPYVEEVSDRQAAEAVRGRSDWQYALSLELTDPGFDSTVLSEFRTRLVVGSAEQRLLDALLERCRERKWLKARGRQRTDSTHVLACVRAVNRLECVGETLRHTLNSLAVVAPAWLHTHCQVEWGERYGRRVWVQQFYMESGGVHWRTAKEGIPPSGLFISSPYDVEARYGKKQTTSWVGYKVHVTEACEDDAPHIITHVETTAGPVSDGAATPRIHQALARQGLLPTTHIVDTGYLDAELLVTSQREYNVDLLGPMRADCKWQAQAAQGFDASQFQIDWEQQRATCPGGYTSLSWTPAVDDRTNEVVKIKFSMKDCQPCASRVHCTRAKRRTITVRRQDHHIALQAARARETSAAYTTEYARRAGVEGTLSQGIRAYGLRHARYIGEAKTHLQHVLMAAAINFVRIGNWLMKKPLAKTRRSAFQKLITQPACC
jgi:transposase